MGHAMMPCKWPVNCIDVINNIDGMNHMFQVSMDGPSTNWKFLETLQKDDIEKRQYELIDIWPCSLYVIHGAFKTGAESSGWNIKAIFKRVF